MSSDKYILNFLENDNNYYLNNNNNILEKISECLPQDFCLYHIQELTFEEKSPRKEALENVLSSLRLDGINFIYLIIGDGTGVHFYFGVAKDLTERKDLDLAITEIGKYILKPSINGNFRGSKVETVDNHNKFNIKSKLSEMNYYGLLEGVPGINKDNENFQGVDRLVDVMLGDEFCVSIIASPLNKDDILSIEKNLYEAYSNISPLMKNIVQKGTSEGTSISNSKSDSSSKTTGSNSSESKTEGTTTNTSESKSTTYSKTMGTSKSKTSGSSSGESSSSTNKSGTEGSSTQESNGYSNQETKGDSKSKSQAISNGTNKSVSDSTSLSESTSSNTGHSTNSTTEYLNRETQEWIKYLDEVIIPRLDYGKSKGLFMTTTLLATNNKASLIKLGNTMKSLYSGIEGNKIPLEMHYIRNEEYLNYYKNFQIPKWQIDEQNLEEKVPRAVISQYIKDNGWRFANWISTNELSLIAGLPQKEVVGLSLKEEVEFGLNFKMNIEKENQISIGNLVQSGNKTNINVNLDKENLNKHTFIAGVTGSGKTTTCQKLLIDSYLPFMVIEPAKTEYRILTENYEDILIFTLGKESLAPFRLNPFEFYEHENISSRVDMIKACIEAAFDMEAAIPQIIETSIYECYESLGWNIASNKNIKYKNPFADGVYAFPTISDLIRKTEEVVERQGFDERLKKDYIGSIKARLQGLTVGSKGLMLDTRRSIDFKELVNRKVILELEEIKNGNEKSLIMGFILLNLNEAIRANFNENTSFRHITLVEEAHRLLSKYEPGDSLNKKQGVEAFTDMLAEVRKYGESLIIVDQIPNKLTPEILKNTNTKIVHKIFAKDDKDVIGNTMALKDEQKEFMSSLDVGRAIVFTQGWDKALQVQINPSTNTTRKDIISDKVIRENALKFYQENYKSGVLVGLEMLNEKPSIEVVGKYLELVQESTLANEYELLVQTRNSNFNFRNYINNICPLNDINIISGYLTKLFYEEDEDISFIELKEKIYSVLKDVMNETSEKIKLSRDTQYEIRSISRR